MSAIQPVITLYGRRGCHLCAEARKMLDRLAPRLGFTVEEIDIDTDAELLVRYDIIVPVVAYGKDELARAPIDHAALQRLVAAALGGR